MPAKTRDAPPTGAAIAPSGTVRSRLLIIDDFLPLELAEAMRADIDNHFARPETHGPDHQVWNYWYVPELYAYLKTQPAKVIDEARVEAFQDRLQGWAIETLGLGSVTPPFLSLYVAGCRQHLHNDSLNGSFGYVYSLTRNERRTSGGETIVHHEGDPFRRRLTSAGAGRNFFDAVPPKFNRLVLFDDRLPHAVERVDGSMDPREGRFVMHGHIRGAGGVATGPRPSQAVLRQIIEAVQEFVRGAPEDLSVYHGPLSLRLDIAPNGSVTQCRVLLDRIVHAASDGDTVWEGVVGRLVERLSGLKFEPAAGPTQAILPVNFGASGR